MAKTYYTVECTEAVAENMAAYESGVIIQREFLFSKIPGNSSYDIYRFTISSKYFNPARWTSFSVEKHPVTF